jgi:hypothetical protein
VIFFACDGASVMVGKISGIGKLLQNKFQKVDIIIWYCLSHQLELAVHDCIADTNAINHFTTFIDAIYALFS